jgi:drug/metabolite transporter (DMT)-like permease
MILFYYIKMTWLFALSVSAIVVLWGLQSPTQKWLVTQLPYTCVIFLSSLFYCLAVFTYGFIHRDVIYANIHKIQRIHVFALIFTGIIAGFLANLLFYKLLTTTNTAVLTTFVKLSPIVTALVAYFWLGEPLTKQMLLGIIVVMCGLVLITQGNNTPTNNVIAK